MGFHRPNISYAVHSMLAPPEFRGRELRQARKQVMQGEHPTAAASGRTLEDVVSQYIMLAAAAIGQEGQTSRKIIDRLTIERDLRRSLCSRQVASRLRQLHEREPVVDFKEIHRVAEDELHHNFLEPFNGLPLTDTIIIAMHGLEREVHAERTVAAAATQELVLAEVS